MERKQTPQTGQLDKAIAKIESEVREGITHGHFDLAISCKVATNGKRELLVKAGKNHRYVIPEPEPKQAA